MPRRSAGLLIHRLGSCDLEVLLVHPGGPFWRGRDVGAWQIPKGEVEVGEDERIAARREAEEELGVSFDGILKPLGEVRQAGGKHVVAFAAESDVDAATVVSSTVEIEWPPRSGKRLAVPEIDEARWLSVPEARRLTLPGQIPFLDRLEAALADPRPGGECLDVAQVRPSHDDQERA